MPKRPNRYSRCTDRYTVLPTELPKHLKPLTRPGGMTVALRSDAPHAAAGYRESTAMKTFTVLAAALLLGACSGTGNSMGVNASDVAALDQAAAKISSSAASYQTSTANMASPAECSAAVQQYTAQVQPNVDRIAQMSGRMDAAMSSVGQMMGADMECGADVMQHELTHHLGVACTSADMATNRAEAMRHVQAMQELADHMRMRADEMGTMMGPGGMMGGGMSMGGGTGTAMMDGGWVTPDGGTIPFDHTMPGCTYAGGGFHPDGGSPSDGGTVQ